MDFTLLVEGLRQAKYITPLEKDILDTWNELQKDPFDRTRSPSYQKNKYEKAPRQSERLVWAELRTFAFE